MPHIPYVIDNIEHRLADVLTHLLKHRPSQALDVATAYFSVRGYQQVRGSIESLAAFRLLIGEQPKDADDIGASPDAAEYLRHELNAEPLKPDTLRLVEDLIRFLRRDSVQVRHYLGRTPGERGRARFLHAKAYLLYGGTGGINPQVAIVGSSNFTGPGLTTNRELNLVHKTLLDAEEIDDPVARQEVRYLAGRDAESISSEQRHLAKSEVGARAILDLARWYDAQWELSEDFKAQLIELLENSKFGGREYTPYEVYLKALYEYFRDDLDADDLTGATRSVVELSEFQADAVKKANRILARYDGVLVGDSVGLGKTWIGKKLLEDRAYHLRQKALVICPAALRTMWERELQTATISAVVVTQEALGQKIFDPRPYQDADVILVDEAHNFRNRNAQRYKNLEVVIAGNGRRGKSGERKKIILLTATPINNTVFDLYNQINLFTGGDRSYFASAGIGDLYSYFLAARRESVERGNVRVFNLLEEVVIRRTRQFIKRAYPDATINGKPIKWPERRLQTIRYNLHATYQGFYADIVRRIEKLTLAHYNLEAYKKASITPDDWELGRQEALVGIFKSRFLKRLESSISAFEISIRRALEFIKTFDEYVQDNIILDATSFNTALRLLQSDDEDDDETPSSRAEEFDANTEAKVLIDSLTKLDPAKFDRRALRRALQSDIDALSAIWHDIQQLSRGKDAKIQRLAGLLNNELRGQKVIIFTYYKDTARHVERELREIVKNWDKQPVIRRVDSSVKSTDRQRIVAQFSPISSGQPNIKDTPDEVDILIATDVLSEGQNLQDCGCLINYDLHWNPTRMVQRSGRIDRLGTAFDTLTIGNLFPEDELENLLGLVKSLTAKIDTINQTGFLDASVLGEVVTPRDFNTLKRIAAEDDTIIEEQESLVELASSESLLSELQKALASQARDWITDLDDGIHSGIYRDRAKGVFFYFTAETKGKDGQAAGRQHFWRYYDLNTRKITDNRFEIMQLIAATSETPRFPPPYNEVDIFAVQDAIIASITQSSTHQVALQSVPKIVSPEQITLSELLASNLSHPATSRDEVLTLRKSFQQPLEGVYVSEIRSALQDYAQTKVFEGLLAVARHIYAQRGIVTPSSTPEGDIVRAEDLRLICYEYVWG